MPLKELIQGRFNKEPLKMLHFALRGFQRLFEVHRVPKTIAKP